MIHPKTQSFMAERMKATIRSFAVDEYLRQQDQGRCLSAQETR
jgi:hypothetical protein